MALQIPPNCDLTLGMVCVDKSTPGRCTWTATPDRRFANPAGILQGGFLAAMTDSAMGAAAITHGLGSRAAKFFVANAEMKISFFAAVEIGTKLTVVAEVVSAGSRTAFVEASVVSEDDTLVARATSTYLFKERRDDQLSSESAYGSS